MQSRKKHYANKSKKDQSSLGLNFDTFLQEVIFLTASAICTEKIPIQNRRPCLDYSPVPNCKGGG